MFTTLLLLLVSALPLAVLDSVCTWPSKCMQVSKCVHGMNHVKMATQPVLHTCSRLDGSLHVCCPSYLHSSYPDVSSSQQDNMTSSSRQRPTRIPFGFTVTEKTLSEQKAKPPISAWVFASQKPQTTSTFVTQRPLQTTRAVTMGVQSFLGNTITTRRPNPESLARHPNIHLLPKDCGKAAVNPDRVINGNNATMGQFPWMVILGDKTSEGTFTVTCGGTLISWRYVLTAAHCLKSSVRLARLGEHVLSTKLDCNHEKQCADSVQDVEIEDKVVHPAYNKPHLKNDIALVRLKNSQPKLFSLYIRPICIPLVQRQQSYARKKLLVAGWGTSIRDKRGSSDVMQVAELPEVKQDVCNSAQEDFLKPVVESQMCAGPSTSRGASACHGDSGGPLMDVQAIANEAGVKEATVVQLGIVSVGSKDCGLYGSPSIYTRVAYFTPWILDELKN